MSMSLTPIKRSILDPKIYAYKNENGKKKQYNITEFILQFLGESDWKSLGHINKNWESQKWHTFPWIASEENIPAPLECRVIHTLHRSEAQAVQRQIGTNLPFTAATGLIDQHCIDAGANSTTHLGFSWVTAYYVAIKITFGSDALDIEPEVVQTCAVSPEGQIAVYQLIDLKELNLDQQLIASFSKPPLQQHRRERTAIPQLEVAGELSISEDKCQKTIEKLQKEDAEAFGLLEVLSYLSHTAPLPYSLLNDIAPPQAIAVLKQHALLQHNRKGEFSIDSRIQKHVCLQHTPEKQLDVLAKAMKALHICYDVREITPSVKLNAQALLPHARVLLSHYDKLSNPPNELVKFWANVMLDMDCFHEEDTQLDQRKKTLEHVHRCIQQVFGENDKAYAKSLNRLGNVYYGLYKYEEARTYYEQSLAIRYKLLDDSDLDVAGFHGNLGRVLQVLGKYEEARKHHEQALTIRCRALGDSHADVAKSHTELGTVLQDLGFYEQARTHHEQALAISLKLLDNPQMYNALNNLGNTWDALGDLKKARMYHQKALDNARKSANRTHLSASLNNLGIICAQLGDLKDALKYQEETLKIRLEIFEKPNHNVAAAYDNLGNTYFSLGNYEQACAYQEEGLKIRLEALGEAHPDVAISYNNLGNTYNRLGDLRKAHEYHTQALAIRRKALGDLHVLVASSLMNLGNVKLASRQPVSACFYFEKALKISKVHGEKHLNNIDLYQNLGEAYHQSGDLKKAFSNYEYALDISRSASGDSHLKCSYFLQMLGRITHRLGDLNKARTYYIQSLDVLRKHYGVTPHISIVYCLYNIGTISFYLDDIQQAVNLLKESYEIAVKLLGKDHDEAIKLDKLYQTALEKLSKV